MCSWHVLQQTGQCVTSLLIQVGAQCYKFLYSVLSSRKQPLHGLLRLHVGGCSLYMLARVQKVTCNYHSTDTMSQCETYGIQHAFACAVVPRHLVASQDRSSDVLMHISKKGKQPPTIIRHTSAPCLLSCQLCVLHCLQMVQSKSQSRDIKLSPLYNSLLESHLLRQPKHSNAASRCRMKF